ncbi:putative iron-regulated membrane protein [Sphingobium subterraneum]|uniref:Putative iron-regulated membrane protein n=2 Tax=Sphingobium subterraneum TaxID=627688 RepID=A0A841J323_9SPHN|nr:putative iron-regulated membrane protein [Sphingobium subterraneum]
MSLSAPVSDARAVPVGHRLKRWLYIGHRWLGIGSCILFAMWFLSGLVMIYMPFPALTQSERLADLPAIDWRLVRRFPATDLQAAGVESLPRRAVLEMRGALPVWRVRADRGDERTISALDGTMQLPPTEGQARDIAERFGHAPALGVTRVERDQWTVAGSFDGHRPLWKVALAGPGQRILYVSGETGAVMLDTNRTERFWNWLGSVPHWLYFTVVRQDNALWRQVVMWVAAPCIVVGVTGFWIGILRARLGRRRYRDGRMSPYRGWMLWHHWAGFLGGLFLITWIFSGWLSVDPFRLFFGKGGIASEAVERYEAAGWSSPPPLRVLARQGGSAKQVELGWVHGRPFLELRWPGRTRVLDARTLQPFRPVIAPAALMPNAHVVAVNRLTEPDAYWYQAGGLPKLPVLRVRYDDDARTWVHLDPATGRMLGDLDARGRTYRWLFDLLHKWDLNVLTQSRPSWDVLLWLLSGLGLVTSVSGIWLGWKRLRRPHQRPSLVNPRRGTRSAHD